MIYLYLTSIIMANVVTAQFAPLNFGWCIVPYGTFIIGLTFIFRDLVQQRIGRRKTYGVIGLALVLSAVTSAILGDPLTIVIASAVTFAFSETADTEIFTRLRGTFIEKVLYSSVIGGIVDSSIFVIIGLSPFGAGFLSWSQVPLAILGQILVKTLMQLGSVIAIRRFM